MKNAHFLPQYKMFFLKSYWVPGEAQSAFKFWGLKNSFGKLGLNK
jgi:hypothetical protein